MKTLIWFFGTGNFASTHMFKGLTRFGTARGWRVLALPRPHGNAAMRDMLQFWKPDGIVADAYYDPKAFGKTAVVNMAERPKGYTGNAVFIRNPTEETVRLAVDELLDLGYAHFAFVNAIGDKDWSRQRETCFSGLLLKLGIPCAACESPASDRLHPLRFHRRLRRFLADLPKPCAVLAAHDPVGRDVIYAANALGLDVPNDLAVCGIDNDTDICLGTNPTLTSVANDFEDAGRLAGEAFERLFSGGAVPDGVHRPSVAIRRGSTAQLKRHDPLVTQAQEFIRHAATSGITANEVATLFPCSRRMAQIRFREATGQTIMQAIVAARLDESQRLLSDDELTFDAVAQLSGWGTLRNFQRQILRTTGLTLQQWRQSLQANPHSNRK